MGSVGVVTAGSTIWVETLVTTVVAMVVSLHVGTTVTVPTFVIPGATVVTYENVSYVQFWSRAWGEDQGNHLQ